MATIVIYNFQTLPRSSFVILANHEGNVRSVKNQNKHSMETGKFKFITMNSLSTPVQDNTRLHHHRTILTAKLFTRWDMSFSSGCALVTSEKHGWKSRVETIHGYTNILVYSSIYPQQNEVIITIKFLHPHWIQYLYRYCVTVHNVIMMYAETEIMSSGTGGIPISTLKLTSCIEDLNIT